MTNWIATIYNTLKAAETGIETIDNDKQIRMAAFKEGAHQKVIVAEGYSSTEMSESALRAMGDISGDMFYVKPTGDDANDGTSWANAVLTIDHAMGLCTNDNYDGIIVARGDYDEDANGATGVECDVSGVTILGLGTDTEISNTDVTDNGAVFTITGWDVRFKNIVAYKGESTSTGSTVFDILDTPWATKYTKLYGVVALNQNVATGTILKAPNGCNGVQIGPYFNENSEFWGGGSGIGIDFDAVDLEMRDTKISGFATGLSLGANASKTSMSRDSIIAHCTTGILLAAGANNNIFNMAMPSNTTDITDNSGVSTNDYHQSIAYIHHEMRHIPKRSGITWYVDGTSGLDTNCGCNPQEGFATIGAGITALSVGDRVVVMAKATKYDEAGLDLNVQACTIEFEHGAVLEDTGGGTVLTVSAQDCELRNVFIDNNGNGGTCFDINSAVTAQLYGCIAMEGTTGFDIDSNKPLVRDCVAISNSVCGFDIKSKYGVYSGCVANGDGAAVRGFYLSDNTTDMNSFDCCHSLNNTTAGWEIVAGADENVINGSSSGGTDGAKVDAGTNNSWPNWNIGSQIVAGQSKDQDRKDIYDIVTRDRQVSFFVSDMQASATLDDSGTADISLPSVTIASGALPTGHTIEEVYCHLKYGSRKDTSTADNAIDGTQYVQVKESAAGSYINAVKIIDNGLAIDVSQADVMGGDVIFGNIDTIAQVAAENKTYNFQWTNCKVVGNNLILGDVQTIIEVRWY